jgi:putative transposase
MRHGTVMPRKGKYSKAEIAAKLAQADELATQGKLQSEIAHMLGVSVMTLHRWRKMSLAPHAAPAGAKERDRLDQAPQSSRMAELQLENSRLKRLVIDLLLEKTRLEEAFQVSEPSTRRGSR